MEGLRWISGAMTAGLLLAPGLATAQTTAPAADTAALEARIAQLEAELNSLKSEIRSSRAVSTPATLPPGAVPVAAPAPASPTPAPPLAPQVAQASEPQGLRIGNHVLKFGGFIKADASLTQFSDGNPPSTDLGRNFYLPSSIPVGGEREDPVNDFTARQTRFWLTSEGTVGGHKVGTRIEMDFQALPGSGDYRTTNAANPALRRAFVSIDNWLIGQEWSTFAHPGVLPETADYVGATDSAIITRQPQVRYSRNGFAIALENPETTLSPAGGGARLVADDNSLPDLTARYGLTRPWGEAQIAGLVRQLKYVDPASTTDATAAGWGLSATALFKVGSQDDIRLMLAGGEGIGRYVGLNLGNDAVLDAEGELHTIGVLAGYAAYRHLWRTDLRSSLIVSGQWLDNPDTLAGPLVNRSASSVRGNLIWTPLTGFDLGAELMFGKREIESGDSGDMTRLTLFAKYGF